MSEQRVDIPNHANWPTNTLDDLCEVISRGKGPRYVESSSVSAIGQRCITDTGFDASLSRPHDDNAMGGHLIPVSGDVLLNSTGTGTIGRSSVFDGYGNFIVDSHVTVLRPRKREIDSKWLDELLRNPRLQRHLEANCYTGSTNQLELSRSQLMKSSVPTPMYDEQRLIAQILDTLDTQIQKTEALIAKLEKVKEGLLHDLLTRGIDENGQLRPSPEQAPGLYKESPLGLIPREWKIVSFQEIYESFPDGNYAEKYPKSSDFVDNGVPFLRANNIKEGTVVDSDLLYITEQQHADLKRGHLMKGDYLITTRGEIGNTARVPSRFIGANVNAQIVILRSSDRSLNEYIAAFSETSGFKAQVTSGQTGTALKQLPTGNLKRLLVPMPEKDERTRISRAIKNSKKQRRKEKDKCAAFYAFKQGLMDDLLTGRVRVTPLLEQAQATTPA